MEDHDGIHGGQPEQDFGPVGFFMHGPTRSLEGPHGFIPIHGHHQRIPQGPRLRQIPHMPRMQDVKASTREDKPLPKRIKGIAPFRRLLCRDRFR
jgi:hypothetical protein